MASKTLEDKLELFRESSVIIKDKALMDKERFVNGCYNKVYGYKSCEGPFEISVYFNDDHKTWAVNADKLTWNQYSKEFDLPLCAIRDEQYLDEILLSMNHLTNNWDNLFTPKRRGLSFMK